MIKIPLTLYIGYALGVAVCLCAFGYFEFMTMQAAAKAIVSDWTLMFCLWFLSYLSQNKWI